MTEAIAHALSSELKRERDQRKLEECLEDLVNEMMAMARPGAM
jgi:hypothetical protein